MLIIKTVPPTLEEQLQNLRLLSFECLKPNVAVLELLLLLF